MFGSGGAGIGITLENNPPAIGFNQYNNAGIPSYYIPFLIFT
jgi:hypothetical protein